MKLNPKIGIKFTPIILSMGSLALIAMVELGKNIIGNIKLITKYPINRKFENLNKQIITRTNPKEIIVNREPVL